MNEERNVTEAETPHTPDPALVDQLLRAREGSGEALTALQTAYRPLMDSMLSRYSVGMTDQERADMREEAERAFLRAVTRYDLESPRITFGAFAKICMRNGLISARNELYEMRRESMVALEDEELADDGDIAAELADEENFRHLCRVVSGHLSDYENRIWWQYVMGVSVADIAKGLGRDERSVHNAIYRIRKKLRKRLTLD
jgi:RNA polymerase sporulation-specific sigma factor